METEKIYIQNEKRDGKTLVKTSLYFNDKNSNSLLRMLAVVSLCEKYGVEIGQEIGTGFNAGLVSYKFAVPNIVIPNYITELNQEVDLLEIANYELLPLDNFLKELDALYISFYNQLATLKED